METRHVCVMRDRRRVWSRRPGKPRCHHRSSRALSAAPRLCGDCRCRTEGARKLNLAHTRAPGIAVCFYGAIWVCFRAGQRQRVFAGAGEPRAAAGEGPGGRGGTVIWLGHTEESRHHTGPRTARGRRLIVPRVLRRRGRRAGPPIAFYTACSRAEQMPCMYCHSPPTARSTRGSPACSSAWGATCRGAACRRGGVAGRAQLPRRARHAVETATPTAGGTTGSAARPSPGAHPQDPAAKFPPLHARERRSAVPEPATGR